MALPEEKGFHGGVPTDETTKNSSVTEYSSTADNKLKGNNILTFPNDLVDVEEGREVIRFSVRKRADLDDIPHSVYLYQTPGFSLADGASYSGSEFGLYGRSTLAAVDKAVESTGGVSIGDFAFGIGEELKSAFTPSDENDGGAGLDIGSVLMGKLGTAGKSLQMKQGRVLNPFNNLTYSGPMLRSFNFSYKLVAESEEESETIRQIEHVFRKYMYPEEQALGFILKYPPYFMIQFLIAQKSEDGQLKWRENPHLPFLHLSYLQSMTATYNSSTNAFHRGGAPVEVDLSLTFAEAQLQTRSSLYNKGEGLEYKDGRPRQGITSVTAEDIEEGAATVTTTIQGSGD